MQVRVLSLTPNNESVVPIGRTLSSKVRCCGFESYLARQIFYPVSLMVRTLAFQVGNTGSIPVQDAKFNLCVMSVRSDGRPWKSEVVGSNPTTQTSLMRG